MTGRQSEGDLLEDVLAGACCRLNRLAAGHVVELDAMRTEVRVEIVGIVHQIIEQPGIGQWASRAECIGIDPEMFFPERGGASSEAKKVCRSCPVRVDCLEYALAAGERFGVWGGTSEKERRKIRRDRARRPVA